MSTDLLIPAKLDEELKTRVTSDQRQQVEELARSRQLASSDIVREALREYFERRDTTQPEKEGAAE